jgi:hypothetical protein
MLAQPELQASDLVPNKYEGTQSNSSSTVWPACRVLTDGSKPSDPCVLNDAKNSMLCPCSMCAGGFKLWEGAIQPCNHPSHWQQRQHVVSVFNVCAGGFKLWEGAIDLCSFLISQHQLTAEALARGQTSLRVGELLPAAVDPGAGSFW